MRRKLIKLHCIKLSYECKPEVLGTRNFLLNFISFQIQKMAQQNAEKGLEMEVSQSNRILLRIVPIRFKNEFFLPVHPKNIVCYKSLPEISALFYVSIDNLVYIRFSSF
jgi:hypothetical protein